MITNKITIYIFLYCISCIISLSLACEAIKLSFKDTESNKSNIDRRVLGIPSTPVITYPEDGATVITSTPTLAGSADAQVTIDLYADALLVGSSESALDGTWAVTSGRPLSDGLHNFYVCAHNENGTSGQSNKRALLVNVPVIASPVITLYPQMSGSQMPIITGTSTVSSGFIFVYLEGALVGGTSTDSSGNWIYSPSYNLENGAYNFTFTALDAHFNESQMSIPITIEIDTAYFPLPTITNPGIPVNSLSGTAEANAQVYIYANTQLLGNTVADSSGAWSFNSTTLDSGTYNFALISLNTNTVKMQSKSVSITII